MKIMKTFNRDAWKRSKKVKALQKVMDKLKKKKHKLEKELEDESSGKKTKKLKIKLNLANSAELNRYAAQWVLENG